MTYNYLWKIRRCFSRITLCSPRTLLHTLCTKRKLHLISPCGMVSLCHWPWLMVLKMTQGYSVTDPNRGSPGKIDEENVTFFWWRVYVSAELPVWPFSDRIYWTQLVLKNCFLSPISMKFINGSIWILHIHSFVRPSIHAVYLNLLNSNQNVLSNSHRTDVKTDI